MLYQLSYASSSAALFESAIPPGNLPESEMYADTLQLSAYTAQESRLA